MSRRSIGVSDMGSRMCNMNILFASAIKRTPAFLSDIVLVVVVVVVVEVACAALTMPRYSRSLSPPPPPAQLDALLYAWLLAVGEYRDGDGADRSTLRQRESPSINRMLAHVAHVVCQWCASVRFDTMPKAFVRGCGVAG